MLSYPYIVLLSLLQLLLFICIPSFNAYRVHQMRVCIQSVDPSRLPSQCVYCKTRTFPITVRLCTTSTYLPARMTLNEAYCLTTACRRQLPRRPPEPFSGGSANAAAIAGVAHSVPSLGTGINSEESGFNSMGSSNGETNSNDMENYEEAESLMAQQPTKVRPPAKFFLGQPQKYKNPLRPSIFG